MTVGRLAVEKNLEAFLKLDLPGTKVVVGDGPARNGLAQKFPRVVFLGSRQGEALAEIYAAADVFVFPSRTDTFGLVLLEALASGVPVAAFPAAAPRDVIGDAPVGMLDEDLRRACLGALECSRQDCRDFALGMTWAASARIFLDHVSHGVRSGANFGDSAGLPVNMTAGVNSESRSDEAVPHMTGSRGQRYSRAMGAIDNTILPTAADIEAAANDLPALRSDPADQCARAG